MPDKLNQLDYLICKDVIKNVFAKVNKSFDKLFV